MERLELAKSTSWNAQQYGKFSALILDYLNQNDSTFDLYSKFPTDLNLAEQAKEKLAHFAHRDSVFRILKNQLATFSLFPKQIENLEKFKLSNTVTITTGHQLNLMTGPLYFFYKILQTLKACEEMSQKHPEFHFVPIFWMATEDHDFEEINHFYTQNQKFVWNKAVKGAVGKLDLDGMQETMDSFLATLPDSSHAKILKNWVESSYLDSKNLGEASKKLVQDLFGERGLLFIDGDDFELKKLIVPTFREDLIQHTAFEKLEETNAKLTKSGYSIQVNPREINLFYLGMGEIRERIVLEDGKYQVLNSDYTFSEAEILNELENHPERFSPNVILRPLYQESILPNIAYIGGSGEIAYWLQLKSFFDSQNLVFPLLIVRNSFLVLSEKQRQKLEKLKIDYTDLFQPLYQLVNQNILENTEVNLDFSDYKNKLVKMFDDLEEKAVQTDVSFSKMVNAQRKKQLKGLENMANRFTKAEKRKNSQRVEQIEILYSELFPNGNLQERILNFTPFWLEYGSAFQSEIYREISPIDFRFTIKTLA